MSLEEIRKKWEKIEEEDAQTRSKMADWEFINRQRPLIRNALIYYIKTGDIRRACRMARMGINEFRELLRKASIPIIT